MAALPLAQRIAPGVQTTVWQRPVSQIWPEPHGVSTSVAPSESQVSTLLLSELQLTAKGVQMGAMHSPVVELQALGQMFTKSQALPSGAHTSEAPLLHCLAPGVHTCATQRPSSQSEPVAQGVLVCEAPNESHVSTERPSWLQLVAKGVQMGALQSPVLESQCAGHSCR